MSSLSASSQAIDKDNKHHMDCKSLRVSSTPSSRSWFFSFSCSITSVVVVIVVVEDHQCKCVVVHEEFQEDSRRVSLSLAGRE